MAHDKAAVCCFSGYRPEKLPWHDREDDSRCISLKEKLYNTAEALHWSGVTSFVCGMARGADMYFCETILRLKEKYGGITLEAAIPCEDQARRWNEADRARYYGLVARCDVETLVSRAYTADCMKKRNRYMADKSGVLVTVFDGKFGGTMYTRSYAARRGLRIIDIRP